MSTSTKESVRVLFVDDDDLLRRALFRRASRIAGLTPMEAGSRYEANELIRRHRFVAIISDEDLGDGLGHTLLESVKELQPSCRRALMSGRFAPLLDAPPWELFFSKAEPRKLTAWLEELAATRSSA